MHTNRISPARKILVGLVAAFVLALLPGCETVTLTNLTPGSMPSNPSQIYTFTLRVTPRTQTVIPTSVAPHIILDGQTFPMKPSALGSGLYEFEYSLPAGRDDVAYYYLVNYAIEGNGAQTSSEAYTEVTHAKIVARYVLSLEVNRGPVGARVSILGRGFTPQDVVFFSGVQARTVYESPNSISFSVPPLEPGKNYSVALNGSPGYSPVGTFHIDSSTVSVSPEALTLRTGDQQTLSFTVSNVAPAGGTLLDITTDVPESIIMPEVQVEQGQTTATVTVKGGKPGTGSLFLKGYGAGEITIPVTVTAK
jgi:IPT/TIG domain-containing protein